MGRGSASKRLIRRQGVIFLKICTREDFFPLKSPGSNYSFNFPDTPCMVICWGKFKERKKNITKKYKFANKKKSRKSILLHAVSTSMIISWNLPIANVLYSGVPVNRPVSIIRKYFKVCKWPCIIRFTVASK